MRQKGCQNAGTIHSMIYHAKDKSRVLIKELEAGLAELLHELRMELAADTPEDQQRHIDTSPQVAEIRRKLRQERDNLARPVFTLNHDSEVRNAELVVIDECSMVDEQMGEDLLSFDTKVLVIGDPAQLPPVMGAGFFTERHEPNVMLTEVHRQAADNPIIAMATQTRQRERLDLGSYGDSRVTEADGIGSELALEVDQILVGRNRTRHAYNDRSRQLRGMTEPLPVDGDRLVCLRNNHDKGLLNGAIWMVDDIGEAGEDRVYMTVHPEDGGPSIDVEAHSQYFLGQEDRLGWWERKDAEEFDYGYCLTVHKSQGSQWEDVLLFDESFCFRDDRWRWLYTAITRASERVTVVRT